MAPSAQMMADVNKQKLMLDLDWRVSEGSNSSCRPILIKVDKQGKNSWHNVGPGLEDEDGDYRTGDNRTDTPLLDQLRLPSPSVPAMANPPSLGCKQDKAPQKPQRSRSAKQYTWLLLLQAHKAAGCLAWIAAGVMTLLRHSYSRLFSRQKGDSMVDFEDDVEDDLDMETDAGQESPRSASALIWGRVLSVLLRVLAAASFVLLVFEVISHSSELQLELELHNPFHSILTPLVGVYQNWTGFRAQYIAPYIQKFADGCIYLFIIQSLDKIVLCLGCIWVKLTGFKPLAKGSYKEDADPERPEDAYPMVLVQMPMCNEKEVYRASIAAACRLEWPRSRFLIQVLDDSSDDEAQKLIEAECAMWAASGVPIKYRHRVDRKGYKAGNLDDGMRYDYVKQYEFVAIFDADFQPKPDFLMQTVPHFKDNPDIALVQARWSFVNKDENLLTKLQNINLQFHFEVEQQVNGAFFNFFGFNGTAGVWRISALEDSGGWLDRTTVEDMDIAVRAHLKGWKFVFLPDVEAQCELPESYEAYRKQQHRWHSGPMQLFRLCLKDIIVAKIPWWKKLNVIFLFFLLRKMILPFYSFMLFCIILPLTMFVPEAQLPLWVVCYIPGFMSILNVLPSPRYFPFMIPYLLFENTMSVTKFHAMVAGLFQLRSAHEWVVTKKTGRQQPPLPLPVLTTETPAPQLHDQQQQQQQQSLTDGLLPNSLADLSAVSQGQVQALQMPRVGKVERSALSTVTNSAVAVTSGPGRPQIAVASKPSPGPGRSLRAAGVGAGGDAVCDVGEADKWRGQRGPRASAPARVGLLHAASEPLLTGITGREMSGVGFSESDHSVEAAEAGDGDVLQTAPQAAEAKKSPAGKRLYRNELALALLLLVAAGRSLLSVHGMHFYFLLFQGAAFLAVALDLISERQ